MAQDFANRHSKGAPTSRTTQKSNGGRSPAAAPRAAKAPPGRNYASQSGNRGLWFGAGLLAGLFCALLLYLWLVAPRAGELARLLDPPVTGGTVTTPSVDIEKMQWDFYEIFPRSEVPVVEEYGPAGTKTRVAESQVYVLQTGSFRAAADADKLRAEPSGNGARDPMILQPQVSILSRSDDPMARVIIDGTMDVHVVISLNQSGAGRTEARLTSVPVIDPVPGLTKIVQACAQN